jgi:signal peptidase II
VKRKSRQSLRKRKAGKQLRKFAFFFAALLLALSLDRALKSLAESNLELGETVEIIGSFLAIERVENYGAAFSLFEGNKLFLIIAPIIILVGLLLYLFIRRESLNLMFYLAFGLVFGGGLGNLIDRGMHGKVTDYISVSNFPVFNFADICVVCGVGLILLTGFTEARKR